MWGDFGNIKLLKYCIFFLCNWFSLDFKWCLLGWGYGECFFMKELGCGIGCGWGWLCFVIE